MQELCGGVLLHRVRPGQQAREELFDLSPEWTYLNHGSYGATLRCQRRPKLHHIAPNLRSVMDSCYKRLMFAVPHRRFASELQSWWREQQEQQPVLFMETQALPALKVVSRNHITSPVQHLESHCC